MLHLTNYNKSLTSKRIYDEFRNTEVKYKNRVRSRIANLKDSRNPELRQNVLIGLIAPQRVASMTSEVRPPFYRFKILL